MSARIIDGKTIAADLRGRIADAVHRLRRDRGIVPGIAVVLVGDNPASEVYVRTKSKAVAEAGMKAFDHKLPASTSEPELITLISELNANEEVSGILVAIAVAEADRRAEGHRGHRSFQGRRWLSSAQCRPAGQWPPGTASLHADGLRAAGKVSARIRSLALRRW